MNNFRHIFWTFIVLIFFAGYSFGQQSGDYRSVASGDWSSSSTWEYFNGITWSTPEGGPSGSDTITVRNTDTVLVDVAETITGYVRVQDAAILDTTSGSLVFDDGSTYEHARDDGVVPIATWGTGSTILFSGIVSSTPDNKDQDYYNITLNTPSLVSNRDLGMAGHTIGGDITVLSSGISRWRLVGGQSGTITIMGDIIVQDGQFETQGTGSPTDVIVNHYGDINVTGGAFSISRGSQASGTGTTTWNILGGDFTISDATSRNSNPTEGNAKFVFAGSDTQRVSFTNVDHNGNNIHFKVADSSILVTEGTFTATGLIRNEGEIIANDSLIFADESTYEHARNGGDVPSATWEMGSTAWFTGIRTSTPGNRGQDYYNLTLQTDSMTSNRDMDLGGATIGGDVTLLSSGSVRWRLIGGESGTITIMGDVNVENGSLETQGTSSPTDVIVNHYGNVNVTGGTFAVSRGSQGSGTGTTRWYLHQGDFSISNATTRNSNSTGATFVFTRDNEAQNIILSNVDYGSGGLPIEVDSSTVLVLIDSTAIGGSGKFILSAGAGVAIAHPDGFDAIQTSGDVTISPQALLAFNGSEMQVSNVMPDSLAGLGIENAAGVSINDTSVVGELNVTTGSTLIVDTLGSITANSGSIGGTVINRGELESVNPLTFASGSIYNHDRDGGDVPDGDWQEGSEAQFTGIISSTPGNRGQDYYNLTLNTPGLISNKDMSLVDNTIGGDLTLLSSGSARWRLVGGDTTTISIMGDVIVQEGSLETQGTSSLTVVEVHHYGDVNVTGGTFAVSRGSQANGMGSTRWFMHEGDFSISDARTRNSNPSNAWFVFDGDTQSVALNNVNFSNGGFPVEIANGTQVDFGESQIEGSGIFVLNPGATLATSNSGGIDSTLQSTGDLTLSNEASFMFNGSVSQETGTLMPDTVDGLKIDNTAGVELSQATLINGVLRLENGVFDNTIPFTLGESGSVSIGEGSLLIPLSIENISSVVPKKFALYQNYPNPFNPVTKIRYDLAKRANVKIRVFDIMGRVVTELVNEPQMAGVYEVTWNASGFASGLYYYQIEAGNFVSVQKLVLMK